MDVTFEGKKQQFGPDGEPLEHTFGTGAATALEHTFGTHKQKKPELQMQGWFRAESGRMDLEPLARRSLQAICDTVEDMKQRGRCLTGKFTNDPEILPDVRFVGVLPFAPEKSQLLVPDAREIIQEEPIFGEEDEDEYEPVEAQPDKTDRWKRLSEFEPLASGTAMLFDESRVNATHFGRVFPGHLDNMYLVEALNAISLRPALARSLFLCYDTKHAVYILRIFKNGIWLKVEVDDYAPLAPNGFEPLCCRSEHFPYILWPSLVEKAYAKVHTLRDGQNPDDNSGGWMAIGGGGQVEDALADLTGGVSGRFYTQDVSPDRLFLYLYNLQRDTLFVCHVNESKCARKGIPLNPCAAHAINRAATHDGRCYVQVFSADPKGARDGGLSELTVPSELLRDYPEKSYEGFFWLAIEDFHAYFSTIIECRLTSSPDVGILGMPPPRLLPGEPTGREPLYFETVFANPGQIAGINSPEISVQTPSAPCEIIISAQQTDSRITQVGDHRKPYVPLLIKVYENLGAGNVYSAQVVCRSNWIPTRDAMVAFQTAGGGSFKVVVEMPEGAMCDRLILRCYSSLPYTEFFVNPSMAKHLLALPQGPPIASRFSLVGTVDPGRIARTDIPEPMSDNLDDVRRRHASSSGAGCVTM